MAQQRRTPDSLGEPGHNGNSHADDGPTLPEEAESLIQIVFEEFEDVLGDYPHHATYCFASITRLAHTDENLSHLARRVGMWLWIKVLSFEIESPLSLKELAEHFDIGTKALRTVIDELVRAGEFDMEWHRKGQIKLAPRMLRETVIYFAEQVLSGIEEAEREKVER